jgi:hypothetical protein
MGHRHALGVLLEISSVLSAPPGEKIASCIPESKYFIATVLQEYVLMDKIGT